MLFSILDFNQEKLIALNETVKPKLDVNDLLLLRYVIEAQVNPSAKHIYKDNVVYAWIKHSDVLQDLPILDIKLDTLSRRLKHLEEIGLLMSRQMSTPGIPGSRTFYAITDLCIDLRQDGIRVPGKKSDELPGKKSDSINTSYINTIKDNSNIKKPIKDIKNNKSSRVNKVTKPVIIQGKNQVQEIIDYYQQNCPGLKHLRAITHDRKQAVKKILETYGPDNVKEVLDKAQNSKFLRGEASNNNRKWKCGFDWIFIEKNFVKVLEGTYDEDFSSNKRKCDVDVNTDTYTDQELEDAKKYHEKLRKEGRRVEY